jgi:zinc protease
MIESVLFYLYNKLKNNKFALIYTFFILKISFSEAQISDKMIFDSLQKLEMRITPKGLKEAHPFQSFITLRPVSEKDSVALELAEYQYENGARVFLMNTPYEKDLIRLKAISWGGYSLYESEEDRKLVFTSPEVIENLGVGDLSRAELIFLMARDTSYKYFLSKMEQVGTFQISELDEQMNIIFHGNQFETAMKVVYNYFTNLKIKNKIAFDEEEARYHIKDWEMRKADSIVLLLNNEHLISTNCNFPDFRNSEKFARAHQLFKERFADGGDFTFVFVGDFSKAQNMVGVFNKYIGNLPKDDKGEFCKFLPTSVKKIPDLISTPDKIVIPHKQLHYEDSTEYNIENIINAKYMSDLYSYYSNKKITPGCDNCPYSYMNYFITHYPLAKISFDIHLGDNNGIKNSEKLCEIIGLYVSELQKKELNLNEIAIFNHYFLEKIDKSYFRNVPYLNYLTQNIMEGLELDKLFKRGELEAYLKTFTPKKIQDLAKKYWNIERRTKIEQ